MANTRVVITTSGQEFNLPGDSWTRESVVSSFSSNVPGIAAMNCVVTTEGDDRVMTFSPRSGSKG
jgi:hypothetical protein